MYKYQVGDMVGFTEEAYEYLKDMLNHVWENYDCVNDVFKIVKVRDGADYPYKLEIGGVIDSSQIFNEDEVEFKGNQRSLPFTWGK